MAQASFVAISVIFSLIVFLCPSTAEETTNKNITVTPGDILERTGKDLEFKCSTNLGYTVFWVNENDTKIADLNSTRIKDDGNGTLTINDAQIDDSGNYTCYAEGKELGIQIIVTIYEMPSYFTEGVIILAINGVLLVIFMICLIYTAIQTKRHSKGGYNNVKEQSL